jgi:DNA-binding response OmpR family regulator
MQRMEILAQAARASAAKADLGLGTIWNGLSARRGDLMNAGHILVVDDDPKVRTLLRRCLEGEGFAVSEAKDGKEMLDCLTRNPVSLVTLDLGLGAENGLDLAREIRKDHAIPIIMLTGKGDAIDRIIGLEVGADDYLPKPFELRELVARVRAVLRRSAGSETPVAAGQRFVFEGWILDIGRRSLLGPDRQSQTLTTSEFNLLEIFVKRPRRVLSRDEIMDLLKGHDWSPVDRSIDNLVARLRKKVEKDPDRPVLIKTVRSIGYTFTADVEKQGRP